MVELTKIGIRKAESRGKGKGPSAMRDLIAWADDNDRSLFLLARPEDEAKMSLAELEAWDERFGFEKLSEQEYSNASRMSREPHGSGREVKSTA